MHATVSGLFTVKPPRGFGLGGAGHCRGAFLALEAGFYCNILASCQGRAALPLSSPSSAYHPPPLAVWGPSGQLPVCMCVCVPSLKTKTEKEREQENERMKERYVEQKQEGEKEKWGLLVRKQASPHPGQLTGPR